jgi:hypothetical protein
MSNLEKLSKEKLNGAQDSKIVGILLGLIGALEKEPSIEQYTEGGSCPGCLKLCLDVLHLSDGNGKDLFTLYYCEKCGHIENGF